MGEGRASQAQLEYLSELTGRDMTKTNIDSSQAASLIKHLRSEKRREIQRQKKLVNVKYVNVRGFTYGYKVNAASVRIMPPDPKTCDHQLMLGRRLRFQYMGFTAPGFSEDWAYADRKHFPRIVTAESVIAFIDSRLS